MFVGHRPSLPCIICGKESDAVCPLCRKPICYVHEKYVGQCKAKK